MTSQARPLRTVGNFTAKDPTQLERQLSQLEQNVDDALRSTVVAFVPVPQPTNTKTAAYVAALDEMVRVNTAAGSVTIVLPVATPQNAGRGIAVARLSAANTLTVAPVSGTVNGAASLALTAAVRLFFLLSDGAGWWSTA